MDAGQHLKHLQDLFSNDFSSKFPSLQVSDAETAPVFVRGRLYAAYAAKREARIRQRTASMMQSPPRPAKKRASLDRDRVLQRVNNEPVRSSVPDFSSMRKENKKPLPASGIPQPSFRTPPKSPGIGRVSRNAGGVRSAKKEVGLVSRSCASLKELKGFSSPPQQSFGGGRVRVSRIGLGYY